MRLVLKGMEDIPSRAFSWVHDRYHIATAVKTHEDQPIH